MLVRHPAGFAASLKRLGWHYDFTELARQSLLLRDHLGRYEDEIAEYARNPPSILEQAALLWRAIYRVVSNWQIAHPHWVYLRHEDLCLNPTDHLQRLFERFGLTGWTQARPVVQRSTTAARNGEVEAHSIEPDSAALVHAWRTALAPWEVEFLRRSTHDVWRYFYRDEDWPT